MPIPIDTVRTRVVPVVANELHEHPVAHRVLAARGVHSSDELSFSLAQLPRPDSLSGIDAAVQRLLEARQRNERVLIIGDYDCDGATSTAVALLGLEMLGFQQLDFLVPNRFEFGYGLSAPIVDVAVQNHQPDLIVTVDNGIASVTGVERAGELGVEVVVTDHHLPPAVLPKAVAIVNPSISGNQFPSRNLAGVGVIFYVLLALRGALARQAGAQPQAPEQAPVQAPAQAPLAELLDLVAIGTVADLVPLDSVNRILVEQGLRRIRAGHTRPGVHALLQVSGRQAANLSTQDIGFALAPRLNAAGRLDDIAWGIRCLLSKQLPEALSLATELDRFNQERRRIESSMRETAEQQMAAAELDDDTSRFSVCLNNESWHQGVIGIVAGRLKEQWHKPVVVFTHDDSGELKGSARSIPGVHIRDVMQAVVARHPGMIEKFGGHAMAAGLSLPKHQFEGFRAAFDEEVQRVLNGVLPTRHWDTDGALTEQEMTLELARELAFLMPWGQQFEPPSFTNTFKVMDVRPVGKGHQKLTLTTDSVSVDAIAFNCDQAIAVGDQLRLVYSLDVNRWRDRESLQLRVLHLEPAVMA